MNQTIGILGAGKFGLALAKLASKNTDVLVYSRRQEVVHALNNQTPYQSTFFESNVRGTSDLTAITHECKVIFPVIASQYFRKVLHEIGPKLTPEHILIHGTKGFDIQNPNFMNTQKLKVDDIKTMSQVIKEESTVLRVGALTGPNIASEIMNNLPTATVIASPFDQVIQIGRKILQGEKFFVFGSYDLRAAELAGSFKNIIAIAAGIMYGKEQGKNVEALLITIGLREIARLAEHFGANPDSFYGIAGIGDLVVTCTSPKSRNFSCGMRIAKGEKIEDIIASMDEVAEGVRSLKVVNYLINEYNLKAPLIKAIYKMVFEYEDPMSIINKLMKFPFRMDQDINIKNITV